MVVLTECIRWVSTVVIMLHSWARHLTHDSHKVTYRGLQNAQLFDLTAKSSEEKETGGISNLSSSVSKGRDLGKPLENVSSKFFIGTEVSLQSSSFIHSLG